jgi:hypothetical protein
VVRPEEAVVFGNKDGRLLPVATMVMGQDPGKVERLYDSVAKEYAEAFRGEHKKKRKDQEILHT